MGSKLKIITINITDPNSDVVALAIRDMQGMIDQGWSIVGQSQYQNSVTYTLLSYTQQVNIDPNFGVDLRETTAVPVQLPRSTTTNTVH